MSDRRNDKKIKELEEKLKKLRKKNCELGAHLSGYKEAYQNLQKSYKKLSVECKSLGDKWRIIDAQNEEFRRLFIAFQHACKVVVNCKLVPSTPITNQSMFFYINNYNNNNNKYDGLLSDSNPEIDPNYSSRYNNNNNKNKESERKSQTISPGVEKNLTTTTNNNDINNSTTTKKRNNLNGSRGSKKRNENIGLQINLNRKNQNKTNGTGMLFIKFKQKYWYISCNTKIR